MRLGLALARRGLGAVWPNPAVGCVLVRQGVVVGRGWTQPGGRPHAETEALARAGAAARGATAYVTLEPCFHTGETPPCADALLDAGVSRCVVAVEDPDPRVSGRGIVRLRDAGVEVIEGVCAEAARALNAGFFSRVERHRPLVTLKMATTLDGRIATRAGRGQWITGDDARRRVHLMRAQNDAVMVGIGTALADNPRLTCRLPGLEERSPIRIVADGRLQLPLTSPLVAGARDVPTWIVTRTGGEPRRLDAFRECGVEILEMRPDDGGRPSMPQAMTALAKRGVTRLLVEGGGVLAASLLGAGLVDRLEWFRAPLVLGGDGVPSAAALGVTDIEAAPRFRRVDVMPVGDDILESYAVLE